MSDFDRRWSRLAAAARRAPARPLPPPPANLGRLPGRPEPDSEWTATWREPRLRALAAAGVFGFAVSLALLPDALAATQGLELPLPDLTRLAVLPAPRIPPPPRLPPPPSLPRYDALVQAFFAEEATP